MRRDPCVLLPGAVLRELVVLLARGACVLLHKTEGILADVSSLVGSLVGETRERRMLRGGGRCLLF